MIGTKAYVEKVLIICFYNKQSRICLEYILAQLNNHDYVKGALNARIKLIVIKYNY